MYLKLKESIRHQDAKAVTMALFVSRKVKTFQEVQYDVELTPDQITAISKISALVFKKHPLYEISGV